MTDPAAELTHLDAQGHARMVDVTDKQPTHREAIAAGEVLMRPETLALIQSGGMPKGDALAVARIAGIMAAKRTHELIPLCHPLPITSVVVELTPRAAETRGAEPGGPAGVRVQARVRCTGVTGVEMEALTAVSVACLTLYDMCKAVDRAMRITDIRLQRKTGGKSGEIILEPTDD
ncbi:MAG: cyclic pyranopterin monophosphate synthase MoaC [Chloroflexota bacterium]